MWVKAFWLALLERAVRTGAQALAALLVADGTDLLNTAWGDRLSVAGMAALVSVLMSVAAGAVSPGTGPSFGTETPTGNVAALVRRTQLQTALGKSVPVSTIVAGPAAPTIPDGTPVSVTREGDA